MQRLLRQNLVESRTTGPAPEKPAGSVAANAVPHRIAVKHRLIGRAVLMQTAVGHGGPLSVVDRL